MRALTICQPYAELILRGEKPIENRTWSTAIRGPLLIHAGKSRAWMDADDERRYPGMTFGAIVGAADLVACLPLTGGVWPEPYQHLRDHAHANGPWCWVLKDVRRLRAPVYVRGAQGLWVPEPSVLNAVREVSA